MLIYNVEALAKSDAELAAVPSPSASPPSSGPATASRPSSTSTAPPRRMYDFQQRCGYCRMDFPNFLEERGDTWRKSSHAWNEEALRRFESALYV